MRVQSIHVSNPYEITQLDVNTATLELDAYEIHALAVAMRRLCKHCGLAITGNNFLSGLLREIQSIESIVTGSFIEPEKQTYHSKPL